jgi:hypothetical protein
MARTTFESLVQIKMGNGKLVYFWRDRWINGQSVADIAPGLWSTVSAHMKNRRTMQQALTNNAWLLDLSSRLPDVFTWPWSASGVYTVSSAYGILTIGSERFALADTIWRSSTTPKCKQYMWLAAKYRIWMSDRQFRHGLQATTTACFVCPQEEDTVKHILLHCVHSR